MKGCRCREEFRDGGDRLGGVGIACEDRLARREIRDLDRESVGAGGRLPRGAIQGLVERAWRRLRWPGVARCPAVFGRAFRGQRNQEAEEDSGKGRKVEATSHLEIIIESSHEIRRSLPNLRSQCPGTGRGGGFSPGWLRPGRRMAAPGARHPGPLESPRGAPGDFWLVPLRGPSPGPRPCRRVDGGPDRPSRRLYRARSRSLADRRVQVYRPPIGRYPAFGIRLRTGPPAVAGLLLSLETVGPSARFGRTGVRGHQHWRGGLDLRVLRDGVGGPGHRAAAGATPPHLEGPGRGTIAKSPRGRATPLPSYRTPPDPGEADRGGRTGDPFGREPDRGGADGVREDGRRPLPRPARRPDFRQTGRLPDVQDTPAEDGGLRAPGDERARFLDTPGSHDREDVRQRPDRLPRGVLPLRQELPGEDGALEHPRTLARELPAPRPGYRFRGGPARGGLSLRGAARARRARRRHRGRLQLRLRARRGDAALDRRGAKGRHPARGRGAQPARPRAEDLFAGAARRRLAGASESPRLAGRRPVRRTG